MLQLFYSLPTPEMSESSTLSLSLSLSLSLLCFGAITRGTCVKVSGTRDGKRNGCLLSCTVWPKPTTKPSQLPDRELIVTLWRFVSRKRERLYYFLKPLLGPLRDWFSSLSLSLLQLLFRSQPVIIMEPSHALLFVVVGGGGQKICFAFSLSLSLSLCTFLPSFSLPYSPALLLFLQRGRARVRRRN